jgi:hypothetical protein
MIMATVTTDEGYTRQTRDFGPRCPNHKCVLDLTDTPGIGICPISSCRFSYDWEEGQKTTQLKIDKYGKEYYDADWKVTPMDGDGEDDQ